MKINWLYRYALYIAHMNMQQMGLILREARKVSGQSQQDVAKPLGMSRATISAIENGTVGEIGVRKLMRCAPRWASPAIRTTLVSTLGRAVPPTENSPIN